MITRVVRLVIIVVVLACLPRPIAAQTGSIAASAGYAFVRDFTDDVNFSRSWVLGGDVGLRPWLSAIAEFTSQSQTTPLVGGDVTLTARALLAGARASVRVGRFVEFGQIAAGVVRTTGTAFGSTESANHGAVQYGGGVEWLLGTRIAARAQLDLRRLDTGHDVRVATSVVYRVRRGR